MSHLGNKDLISRLEALDLAFTGFWSQSISLTCGRFYFNDELPNDVFFNKLTSISCLDEVFLKESLMLFKNHHTIPYFYILNGLDLEEKLIKKNFMHFDTQHVLVRLPGETNSSNVHRISQVESTRWSEIFCAAYDCNEWLQSVNAIVKKSANSVEYYIDESMSACVALYESKSLLSLYCLGTVPKMRHKGYAASLIDFALNEAKIRGVEFLMLETYGRDKLLDFYFKLGFKEIYKKNIYTI